MKWALTTVPDKIQEDPTMLSPASTRHESRSNGGQLAFLRRVNQDDRFRAALTADPQAALAEYGLYVDPEQIPSQVTLPKAESVLDVLIDVEDGQDDLSKERWWYGFVSGRSSSLS